MDEKEFLKRLGIEYEYIYYLENQEFDSQFNQNDENLQIQSTRENDLLINDNENKERNNLENEQHVCIEKSTSDKVNEEGTNDCKTQHLVNDFEGRANDFLIMNTPCYGSKIYESKIMTSSTLGGMLEKQVYKLNGREQQRLTIAAIDVEKNNTIENNQGESNQGQSSQGENNQRENNQGENNQGESNQRENYQGKNNQGEKSHENDFTKQKRKRKEKRDDNSTIRKDNIFKQIKIHAIKFIFDTINELMNQVKFNRFYKLDKNKLTEDFKNKVQKNYNLQILEKTVRKIINDNCKGDANKKIIEKFEAFVENNVEKKIENNNCISIIKRFLKEKFINVIQIFNMPKKEYESEFKLKNNFLLQCNEKIKNKEILKELIKFGVVDYLNNKKERKLK